MKLFLLGTLVVLSVSQGRSTAQARIGFGPSIGDRGPSPTLVAGLATLNTVVPIAVGAKLLYDEQSEGLGVLLLGWGWIVGPAPFSLYYRDTTAGLVGLGIRGASLLIAASVTSGGTWDEDGSAGTEIALVGIMVVSGITTILNIVGLPAAVRRFHDNERLSVTPWINGQAGGLSVAVRW